MRDFELLHAINKLATFYNVTKAPGMAVINAWLPKVEMIPAEAVDFILGRIQDEHDSFPRNIPKTFRQFYREWLAANPQPERQVRGCQACEGGVLFLERTRPDGSVETGSTFCAACTPGDPGRVGKAYLAEMEALGWRSVKITVTEQGRAKAQEVRERLARARRQWAKPDPERKDIYGEAEEDSAW